MMPFELQVRTRVVVGAGSLSRLGELAKELNSCRALVVSDSGVVAAGHTQRGIDSLEQASIKAQLFEGVHENPTTRDVDRGVEMASEFKPDLIVGLGGGSSMDCAKGINFIHTNGGQLKDYWGMGHATQPMLPMIAIPTTAGTGSETQCYALISDAQTHVKMACGDRKAAFRSAILDPELTLTQPFGVTAVTGIDAVAHAIETYVTKRRTPISLLYSAEAWRQLAGNFSRVLSHPNDLNARSNMQWGACLAGMAIEHSMLGAAHALANPLTAGHNIVHGQAVAVMLPHVIRYNAEDVGDLYAELAAIAGSRLPVAAAVEWLAEKVRSLIGEAGLRLTLSELGIPREKLPDLANQAEQQWTANFNPRHVSATELLQLYQAAYD